jgi:hypothetical protein
VTSRANGRERLLLRPAWRSRVVVAAALALLASGCGSSAHRKGAATSPQLRWSHATPAPSRYAVVLHPYLLFMGFDREIAGENQLVGSCMRAHGWRRYPVSTGAGAGPPQLNTIQRVDVRLRAARSYGRRVLAASASFSAELAPYTRFADWLREQPYSATWKYGQDISGGRGEDRPPTRSSCKGIALARMRRTVPAAVPSVVARAGALYQRYITRDRRFRRAEKAWRRCMRRRGYMRVGPPLVVSGPGLDLAVERAGRGQLSRRARARLIQALTRQALSEHVCSVRHLDRVLQRGERHVVHALVSDFPRYERLVPTAWRRAERTR